jgi:hypothetical protein
MKRYWKVSLISMIVLAVMLVVTPTPAAARVFVGVGGGWGWGPGWGYGWGPGWYGAGWYGPYWGYPGYWGPPHGTVEFKTHDKAATVYIDGGYAGSLADMHKFQLRPGAHDVAVRAPNGQQLFNQRVDVMRGHTTKIHLPA